MLKKLLVVFSGLLLTAFAWAVDVNTATQAELESVKNIGPKTAETILAERKKGGAFKDDKDFMARVKGIKDKKLAALKKDGLTIGEARK